MKCARAVWKGQKIHFWTISISSQWTSLRFYMMFYGYVKAVGDACLHSATCQTSYGLHNIKRSVKIKFKSFVSHVISDISYSHKYPKSLLWVKSLRSFGFPGAALLMFHLWPQSFWFWLVAALLIYLNLILSLTFLLNIKITFSTISFFAGGPGNGFGFLLLAFFFALVCSIWLPWHIMFIVVSARDKLKQMWR